jgi:cation diffusion facilitator family transporter
MSIAAALITITLKTGAWALTGSVGLLSDAMESVVNLAAAVLMAWALKVSARPADASHLYGHDKAELFSAAAEGAMIVIAAGMIVWTAVDRLLSPRDVERVGAGLAVSCVAAGVNLSAALVLLRAGRRERSLALVADGRHLMTDVWTSGGVVVAVVAVAVTGWRVLDPLVALAVGANIVVTGLRLLWRSGAGLMDPPFPSAERSVVDRVVERYGVDGVRFHALRHRTAGHRRFMSVHLLVPGDWSVSKGHDLAERFERDLRAEIHNLTVVTHVEPIDDAASYGDGDDDDDDEGESIQERRRSS